jgi:hypothetical protein
MAKEPTQKINEDIIRQTDTYLKAYMLNRRMLQLNIYEYKQSLNSEWEEESPGELSMARARMFEIRHNIMSLDNCDEKLMLYYHYIKGETIERCSELIGVSRSSGFRMNRRGLLMLADKMKEINGKN